MRNGQVWRVSSVSRARWLVRLGLTPCDRLLWLSGSPITREMAARILPLPNNAGADNNHCYLEPWKIIRDFSELHRASATCGGAEVLASAASTVWKLNCPPTIFLPANKVELPPRDDDSNEDEWVLDE